MSEEIENQLRRALRPIEPPAGFAERVMRALPERQVPAPVTVLTIAAPPRKSLWQRYSAPAALAASLVVAVLLGQHVGEQRVEREQLAAGLAARQELMQALRVTSRKLDIAYEAVQSTPPEAQHQEENRS